MYFSVHRKVKEKICRINHSAYIKRNINKKGIIGIYRQRNQVLSVFFQLIQFSCRLWLLCIFRQLVAAASRNASVQDKILRQEPVSWYDVMKRGLYQFAYRKNLRSSHFMCGLLTGCGMQNSKEQQAPGSVSSSAPVRQVETAVPEKGIPVLM